MKANKIDLFTAVEFEQGIMVVPRGAKMNIKFEPLISGDLETIGEYLVRYLYARANGKGLDEAHKQALQGANVVTGKLNN